MNTTQINNLIKKLADLSPEEYADLAEYLSRDLQTAIDTHKHNALSNEAIADHYLTLNKYENASSYAKKSQAAKRKLSAIEKAVKDHPRSILLLTRITF